MITPLTRPLETDNPLLRAMGATQLQLSQSMANRAARETPTMGDLVAEMTAQGSAADKAERPIRIDRLIEDNRYQAEAAQLQQDMLAASADELPALRERLQTLEADHNAQLTDETKQLMAAGRVVSPMVLAEKYKLPGIKFDRPMSDEEARLVYESRKADLTRQAIIAQGPSGFVSGVEKFGNSLIAMATDPLEIGTMFIPVLGEAGKAAAVARFGNIGGHILVGAVEGGVGNALTEPAYAILSRAEQLDYTMADSLMNIGLGFVLGGGLGAVAGTVGHFRAREDVRVRDAVDLPDAPKVDVPEVRPAEVVQTPLTLKEEWRVRSETARLADEQRPIADVALRQFATGQQIEVGPVMPTPFDANIMALRKEVRETPKFPISRVLRGIDPTGDVGKELIAAGVTPKTAPGLFKIGGRKNLDNLPASEMEQALPGMSKFVENDFTGMPSQYLSQDKLVQAIIDERAGRDVGLRDKAAAQRDLGGMERDAELWRAAQAAGLPAVAREPVAHPEVVLAEHAAQDKLSDADYSAMVDARQDYPVDQEIADLQDMVSQLSEADAFEVAAELAQIDERAKAFTDAYQAALLCMARQ